MWSVPANICALAKICGCIRDMGLPCVVLSLIGRGRVGKTSSGGWLSEGNGASVSSFHICFRRALQWMSVSDCDTSFLLCCCSRNSAMSRRFIAFKQSFDSLNEMAFVCFFFGSASGGTGVLVFVGLMRRMGVRDVVGPDLTCIFFLCSFV
jgi:hypothetical protein